MRRRAARLGTLAALSALLCVLPIVIFPFGAEQRLVSAPGCRPTDSRLRELSGLASSDGRIYAEVDGSQEATLYELGRDCSVQAVHASQLHATDIEDLGVGPDGAIWMADTGDNWRQRDHLALLVWRPDAAAEPSQPREREWQRIPVRLPDGPRDVEALLLDATGRPLLITKSPIGRSEIYRLNDLAGPGRSPESPRELHRVGALQRSWGASWSDPFGPPGAGMITAAAVSLDRHRVVLRTYRDLLVFGAPHGDVLAALSTTPMVLRAAEQPQGEAVVVSNAGDVVLGSEDGAALRHATVDPRPETEQVRWWQPLWRQLVLATAMLVLAVWMRRPGRDPLGSIPWS